MLCIALSLPLTPKNIWIDNPIVGCENISPEYINSFGTSKCLVPYKALYPLPQWSHSPRASGASSDLVGSCLKGRDFQNMLLYSVVQLRFLLRFNLHLLLGFPGGSMVKNLPAIAGDADSIPGSGRSPGEKNGYPLQYCCLENPMERGSRGVSQKVGHNWACLQTFLLSCASNFFWVNIFQWCVAHSQPLEYLKVHFSWHYLYKFCLEELNVPFT